MLMLGIPSGIPGIPFMLTSPGRCPGVLGPSHFASIVMLFSRIPRMGGSKVVLLSMR